MVLSELGQQQRADSFIAPFGGLRFAGYARERVQQIGTADNSETCSGRQPARA